MLKSLESRFGYIYNDDNFVIATLLDPRFKAAFFDEQTVDSATQNLLTVCKNAVKQSDGEQMQPVVIEDSMESQNNSNSCSNKKRL